MDKIVLDAMAKWPNVPAVAGWLQLDRRGRWLIRGELVENRTLIGFMNRNYVRDMQGRWFFQNGPQQVFVDLDATPWVYRLAPAGGGDWTVLTHTGQVARPAGALVDADGNLYLITQHGLGLLDERDLVLMIDCLVDARQQLADEAQLLAWMERRGAAPGLQLRFGGLLLPLEWVNADRLPERFGFVREPHL